MSREPVQRIILDVDSAGDDILAVLFAAASPQIKLEGITTLTGAAGSVEQATNIVLNLLTLADKEHIPVHAGAWRHFVGNSKADMEAPLVYQNRMKDRFGDRLKKKNPPEPTPNRAPQAQHAVDFIIEKVLRYPGEITLVTTGPLTNAALAFLQEPKVAPALKNLVVLGGTFGIPGNMTPVSESNIWSDPEAARVVLATDVPKILVPLDVCEDNRFGDAMMSRDDIADMQERATQNSVVDMIADKYPIYIDIWREFFGLVSFPMDDIITVAMAIHPDLCEMTDPLFVDVVLQEGIARGQTVAYRGHQILTSDGSKTTRICTSIKGRRFMTLFKDTMALYERAA
ncbi:nucleoside hydrolase [Microvirga antarctica]|uniref:nucleoside hydrolase n=1 Tax=Microvirga antarctica TaxID=2819233 RepID=UPI001B308E4B|nr:nucleoside hydrolase [Microvirga antarctica]